MTVQRVPPVEIFSTLAQLGSNPEDRGSQIMAQYCPVCPKPHNEERTNMFTFGVSKLDGLFNCFRCNQKGNWRQFKRLISEKNGDLFEEAPQKNLENPGNRPFNNSRQDRSHNH
jgi:hypothetical protein